MADFSVVKYEQTPKTTEKKSKRGINFLVLIVGVFVLAEHHAGDVVQDLFQKWFRARLHVWKVWTQ